MTMELSKLRLELDSVKNEVINASPCYAARHGDIKPSVSRIVEIFAVRLSFDFNFFDSCYFHVRLPSF